MGMVSAGIWPIVIYSAFAAYGVKIKAVTIGHLH